MSHKSTIFLISSLTFILIGCSKPNLNKANYKNTKPYSIENTIKKALLTKLFNTSDFDSAGTAIWQQSKKDSVQLPDYFDGKCHTNIDTILYFNDSEGRKCTAIIFTTYNYLPSNDDSTKAYIADCRSCGVPLGIALVSENKDHIWELYKFDKYFTSLGYFGSYNRLGYQDEQAQPSKIGLAQIGDSLTCLRLTLGIGGNMGYLYGFEYFYSIDQLQVKEKEIPKIFEYQYYYSQFVDGIDPEPIEEIAEINFLKSNTQYYDISITSKIKGKEELKQYKYSGETREYVESN